MKLSATDVRVLEALFSSSGGERMGALASRLGLQETNLGRHVGKLARLRFATVVREGRAKKVSAQRAHIAEFAELRHGLPSLRLSDILVGKLPFILAFLARFARKDRFGPAATFRARDINLPGRVSSGLISRLSSSGLVYTVSKGRHAVRPAAFPVTRYCASLISQAFLAEAEAELHGVEGIRVAFENVREPELVIIAGAENSSKKYFPTAFSAMHSFGVRVIGKGKFYYSNIKPVVADVVLHTLALGSDSRGIMFAAAVMVNSPFKYRELHKKDYYYGLQPELLENLVRFVESKGTSTAPGFPEWGEVMGVLDGQAIPAGVHSGSVR